MNKLNSVLLHGPWKLLHKNRERFSTASRTDHIIDSVGPIFYAFDAKRESVG